MKYKTSEVKGTNLVMIVFPKPLKKGSGLGQKYKELLNELKEKRQRVEDLEGLQIISSDKVDQPKGFVAPKDDVDDIIDAL